MGVVEREGDGDAKAQGDGDSKAEGDGGRRASICWAAVVMSIGPWMTARMMPFVSTKYWVGRAYTP